MEELIKILRVCGDSNNSCGNCPIRENDGGCPHGEWEFAAEKYMLQAADVIEKLNESLCKTVDLYQKLLGGHPDMRGEDGEPDMVRDCQYYRGMTNADRIRAMNDEELAQHLWNIRNAERCVISDQKRCIMFDDCIACWLDWLKQEVEG